MIELLKDKKVIFFDVGYTLDYPLSGDWMFTKKFYELVDDKLNKYSSDEIQRARDIELGRGRETWYNPYTYSSKSCFRC